MKDSFSHKDNIFIIIINNQEELNNARNTSFELKHDFHEIQIFE